ncbi:BlaI/MecI/CopY family transcriptional regulator [Ammonicoccus fulvus]|uniref:BlaI/MecI/CopY family transcriptional regulator n=1 Tax=Ammonicoccus fulvus TaxID=3138240 RepID=A0ABZ3FMF0_9ACTN
MAVLGELESRVMDVLWRVREPSSVRDVHTELAIHRDLAYTTVMTVLDRLAKKGLVSRVRQGRQWLYSPAQSRVDLLADEVLELLSEDHRVREAVLGEVLRRLPASDRGNVMRNLFPPAAS